MSEFSAATFSQAFLSLVRQYIEAGHQPPPYSLIMRGCDDHVYRVSNIAAACDELSLLALGITAIVADTPADEMGSDRHPAKRTTALELPERETLADVGERVTPRFAP